jgi:regulator of sigma E protease
MIQNITYYILAIVGLGFLIFIHELGHYFMARRAGMTVEVFSIGFGKPLTSWQRKGVKWQICILPVGGYVRIKGMERKKGAGDLYLLSDGYFGKSPWARIKVAAMGPVVNLVFAFVAFALIWSFGGRDKRFTEHTHLIGWVDPHSKLYELGVRPGDELGRLNGRPFKGLNDLMYAAVLDDKNSVLEGKKIDYFKGLSQEEFDYKLSAYPHPQGADTSIVTMGVLSPAGYLVYDRFPGGAENIFYDGSPMKDSGIQYNDRLLWIDGELLFSQAQLSSLVNQSSAFLTIKRGEQIFVTRIPRLKIADLHFTRRERGEFDDWRHVAKLTDKLSDLYFIPYNLNSQGVVEAPLPFLDEEAEERVHEKPLRSSYEFPLQKEDQIVAVDGKRVNSAAEIMSSLQTRHVIIITEKMEKTKPVSWKEGDENFFANVNFKDLKNMIGSIGTEHPIQEMGNLRLLNPVVPKTLMEFSLSHPKKTALLKEWDAERKEVEAIKDPKERERAMLHLEKNQNKLLLGINLRDQMVNYNPNPFAMTYQVFGEISRTLYGLVSGSIQAKRLAGPVGIIQIIHYGWTMGLKDALYWLGLISLNLGILNLLPLPVLDGGHICFSLYEIITKKRVNHKVVESIIIPFVILLFGLFIYLIYNDLSRLLK